jgi:DNA-binding NarL/FixJ family response regulator
MTPVGADGLVRVVIVDDHPFIVQVLSVALRADPGLELLAVCECGGDALAEVPALDPDVVVLDHMLRDMTGGDVLRELRARGCGARFLMFSAMLDQALADEMLAAGAAGALSKRTKPDGVVAAIHRVAAGETVVEPRE